MMRNLTLIALLLVHFAVNQAFAQHTDILGFAHMDMNRSSADSNGSFIVGEQDLFITSDVTDRISFLGETVFKYSSGSPTSFDVSVERLIIGYNYAGNHRILIGKHHTPVSDWNDRYHHGRVFFPTVGRPLLFEYQLIPIHTTGILFQGLNLGDRNVGYQFMVGNGIGSGDVMDNDQSKSLTVDLHMQPIYGMKFGLTAYLDHFDPGLGNDHHGGQDSVTGHGIDQQLLGGYFRYFHGQTEFVAEYHSVANTHDSAGTAQNSSLYAYAGYRLGDQWVPYLRYDQVDIASNELYLNATNTRMLSLGIRYEFSNLAVAKLEFHHAAYSGKKDNNGLRFQIAVGF